MDREVFKAGSTDQLEVALAGNAALQEKIEALLERVERSLDDNRQHQEELKQLIEECSTYDNTPAGKPIRLQRFSAPYFKDISHSTLPENEEMKWMHEKDDVNACIMNERLWSVKEQKSLERGVKGLCLEELLRPLQDELEAIAKCRRNGSVTDYEALQQRETELAEQIAQIRDSDTAEQQVDVSKLDWERIQSTYLPHRTPMDCFIQWTNVLHPLINKGKWTKDEEKRLLALARQHDQHNWHVIACELGTGRTPFQCLEHYQQNLNSDFYKKAWDKEDDDRLREAVQLHGESSWCAVAEYVGNKRQLSCLHRWMKGINPRLHKGHWTEEEDKELKAAVQLFGEQWCRVATLVEGRSDAQCRERWKNILDPALNQAEWTKEEEKQLLELVAAHKGEKKIWTKIAEKLGTSRTDSHCYRHWLGLISDAERVEYFKNSVRRQAVPAGAKGTSLTVNDIGDEDLPEGVQNLLTKGKKSWYYGPGVRKYRRKKQEKQGKRTYTRRQTAAPSKQAQEGQAPPAKKKAKKPAKPKKSTPKQRVKIVSKEDMLKHLKQVLRVTPPAGEAQPACQLAPLPPSAATLRGLRRLFQEKPNLNAHAVEPPRVVAPPTVSLLTTPSSGVCRWTTPVTPTSATQAHTIVTQTEGSTETNANTTEETRVEVEVIVEHLGRQASHSADSARTPAASQTPNRPSSKDSSVKVSSISHISQPAIELPLETHEFRMLEERFVSLFQWPGLLSCIPLQTKSQTDNSVDRTESQVQNETLA